MHPVLFRIFDFPIHSYGVLIVTGFLLAMYVAWREAVRQGNDLMAEVDARQSEGTSSNLLRFASRFGRLPSARGNGESRLEDEVLDFAFWALLGGIIGARVVFIIVNWRDYANNPVNIFKFWKGGLVFYGAAIGGFLAYVIYAKKRGYGLVRSLQLADIVIVGVPVAHVFGRFGCIAAGCCWGAAMYHTGAGGEVISDIPFAAQFPTGALAYSSLIKSVDPSVAAMMREAGTTMPLFPSQLAESVGEGLIFIVLLFVRSRKWFHGQVLLSYFILYPILRFTLEFFRGDTERGFLIGSLSTSQSISIAVAGGALIALFFMRKKGLARVKLASSTS